MKTRNARLKRARDKWYNLRADDVSYVLRVLADADKDFLWARPEALMYAILLLEREYDPEGLARHERPVK